MKKRIKHLSVLLGIGLLGGLQSQAQQVYNSGSGTYTVPATGVQYLRLQAWGGGGGPHYLQGGGGGAFAGTNDYTVTPGQTFNYTVGSAGQGGYAGGDSKVTTATNTTIVMAKGGQDNGQGGNASDCIGDIRFSGGNGSIGVFYGPDNYHNGSGGGSAFSYANGGNGVSYNGGGGLGEGKGGEGGFSFEMWGSVSTGSGSAGQNPGGGGGGNSNPGGAGRVKIIECSGNNPVISSQPVGSKICKGSNYTLTAAATSLPNSATTLTYQWKLNGQTISNASASSYTITNASTSNTGNYTVDVTDICGKTTTSNVATVSLYGNPVITSQPSSGQFCSPTFLQLSVSASPTPNDPGALTYTWKKDGVILDGYNSYQYLNGYAQAPDAGNYTVTVTGVCNNSTTSNVAIITIYNTPTFTVQPTETTLVCPGQSINLSATAIPSNGTTVSYQWTKDGVNINGATNPTFSKSNITADDFGNYELIATDAQCIAYSGEAAVKPNGPIMPKIQFQIHACTGSTVTLSADAYSPSQTPITYQWRYWSTPISGETQSKLTFTMPNSDAWGYDVVATDGCGSSRSNRYYLVYNNANENYFAPIASSSIINHQSITNADMHFMTLGDCEKLIAYYKNNMDPAYFNIPIESSVWIENTQPQNFVKRHYDIKPSVDPQGIHCDVTLFFTQAEFNAFNATHVDKLPTGPNDAAGKANLLIERRFGSSTNTGMPETYSGLPTDINPDDADIVWKEGLQRWEVTFNTQGLGGFWAKTTNNMVLPLHLTNFTGKRTATANQLEWNTASEDNVKQFTVERSTTGNDWKNIGTVAAKNKPVNSYQYFDPFNAPKTFYRLKMVDMDGTFTYSNVVTIEGKVGSSISIYPNPAKDYFTISGARANSKALLTDAKGATLLQITITSPNQKVSIAQLATGVYNLRLDDGSVQKIIKE